MLSTILTKVLLGPGDIACELAGCRGESDHRMILRTFFNTLVWGAISVGAALALTHRAGL